MFLSRQEWNKSLQPCCSVNALPPPTLSLKKIIFIDTRSGTRKYVQRDSMIESFCPDFCDLICSWCSCLTVLMVHIQIVLIAVATHSEAHPMVSSLKLKSLQPLQLGTIQKKKHEKTEKTWEKPVNNGKDGCTMHCTSASLHQKRSLVAESFIVNNLAFHFFQGW